MAGIFISYRRSDAGGWAGRFWDSLETVFGAKMIFHDIDSIPPGVEFEAYIADAVGSCDVLIALIGPTWVTAGELGKRRLDDPNDFTRMEIAAALRRNIRVIPALVGGASMPKADDLPDDLKPLARRNSYELTDSRWREDCRKLAEMLRPLVEAQRPEPPAGEDGRKRSRLWIIFVIVLVLWAMAMVTSYTFGGLIHILLLIDMVIPIVIVWRMPRGRAINRGR
jgi:hypothetical protein